MRSHPLIKYSAITCGVLFSLGAIGIAAGLRINTSPSLPLGVYRLTGEAISKGAIVIFCPPLTPAFAEAKTRGYIGVGFCPAGHGAMIKKVSALAGDSISVNDEGVYINDRQLPNSVPLATDAGGRTLPHYRVTHKKLNRTEVLLMSDSNGKSFDARYFGPINTAHISGVISPLFTW